MFRGSCESLVIYNKDELQCFLLVWWPKDLLVSILLAWVGWVRLDLVILVFRRSVSVPAPDILRLLREQIASVLWMLCCADGVGDGPVCMA